MKGIPFASRSIKSPKDLWSIKKVELMRRFQFAALVREEVALDFIVAISMVQYEREGAWRPLLLGGIQMATDTQKLRICKLHDAPIGRVMGLEAPLRVSMLGISGSLMFHYPHRKICGKVNPERADEFLVRSC